MSGKKGAIRGVSYRVYRILIPLVCALLIAGTCFVVGAIIAGLHETRRTIDSETNRYISELSQSVGHALEQRLDRSLRILESVSHSCDQESVPAMADSEGEKGKEELQDQERYQTVYSRELGSAAAPTAGLHFTKELLQQIADMGVKIGYVTLHVGLGTFRPVKEDEIEDHPMHSEFCIIPEETARMVNETKANGGRVVCIGTTSCRTVESFADADGTLRAQSGWTDIFIYPGYKFKCMDALVTNFHLPESTLIMLVSALAGREHILNAYKIAVENRYRFFSFGDAMFITNDPV